MAAVVLLAGLLEATTPAHALAQAQCVAPGDPVSPIPWPQHLLAPTRAWPLSTGTGQRVAVVSTGISLTPQLEDAVAGSADLAPAEPAGPSSGRPDCLGVGTGVAGIIAASRTDGIGFHGMAPGADVLAVKIVGDRFPDAGTSAPRSVTPDAMAGGIRWAVGNGATVIVLPTPTYQDSRGLRDAVAQALDSGVVVVASVGEPGPSDEPPGLMPYPAGYSGVIGVGAIGADGLAVSSRARAVDLVAPGADVVTTYPGGGLGPVSGPGYAAAYVAGSVALVRAYRPQLSPAEVARRLYATATPAPEGVGSARYGYGIVDPYHAMVDGLAGGTPQALPSLEPVVLTGEEIARRADEQDSGALASRLAAVGLAVAVAVALAAAFVARGRRRDWRTGLAAVPDERPDGRHPEPPVALFGGSGHFRESQR